MPRSTLAADFDEWVGATKPGSVFDFVIDEDAAGAAKALKVAQTYAADKLVLIFQKMVGPADSVITRGRVYIIKRVRPEWVDVLDRLSRSIPAPCFRV